MPPSNVNRACFVMYGITCTSKADPTAPTLAGLHTMDVTEDHDVVGHVLSVPITTVGVESTVDVNVTPMRVIAEDEVPAVLNGEA